MNRNLNIRQWGLLGASALLSGALVVGLVGNMESTALAKKGGGGNDGNVGGDVSGFVFCQVTFNDRIADGVESDGRGPYVDGTDRADIRIGRNRSVQMDFNNHKSKPSLRTLHFPGGFLAPAAPAPGCEPTGTTPPTAGIAPPSIALAAVDAHLKFGGEDHDDTPVGCRRLVNAVLTVKDDNGQTWVVHFGPRTSPGGFVNAPCGSYMVVERLPNTADGKSQWSFRNFDADVTGETNLPGINGLGYVYRDNNPPHAATEFWGTVSLPMSGTLTSLSDETAPTDCTACFTYGDGVFPGGCP